MSVRVFVAYPYPIVLHALKALIERQGHEVVGDCSDVAKAAEAIPGLQPDVALLDFEMPGGRALDAVRDLSVTARKTKVILLTTHTQAGYVLEAVRLDVKGYVLKTSEPEQLVRTIAEVARGGTYYAPEVSKVVLQSYLYRSQRSGDYLTDREKQVVRLIADGNSTKQVAAHLGISIKTADSHRTRVMEKLNIHETASLVRYAVRQGIVEP